MDSRKMQELLQSMIYMLDPADPDCIMMYVKPLTSGPFCEGYKLELLTPGKDPEGCTAMNAAGHLFKNASDVPHYCEVLEAIQEYKQSRGQIVRVSTG